MKVHTCLHLQVMLRCSLPTLSSKRRCVTSVGSMVSSSGYLLAMRHTHCSEHRSKAASSCSRPGSYAQYNGYESAQVTI